MPEPLTIHEAIAAARESAFPVPGDPERGVEPRFIVHSMAGSLGADWDLPSVVRFIADATEVRWTDPATGGLGEVLGLGTPEAVQALGLRP